MRNAPVERGIFKQTLSDRKREMHRSSLIWNLKKHTKVRWASQQLVKSQKKSVLWIVRVYKWVNDCSLWCEVEINGGKFSKDEVTECTVSAFFLYVQVWLTQLPCNSFLSIVYSLWQRERDRERVGSWYRASQEKTGIKYFTQGHISNGQWKCFRAEFHPRSLPFI